ncbi:MAG: hypothetical protein C0402_00840 [Thermodesulfovibrio sp.]|nr:hypothetical protein [Thermodesulfovibrio sp.]
MRGRLNIFQRTMLQWDSFHPYNVVFLMKIPGRLDQEKLRSSLDSVIERFRIGEFSFDRTLGTYEYAGEYAGEYADRQPKAELRIIPEGEDCLQAVRNEVGLQMNRRFEDKQGKVSPVRFFAVEGEGFFYLGLVCFHVIADGYSIFRIIRNIIGSYSGGPLPKEAPEIYPETYGSLFRQRPLLFFLKSLTLPAFVSGLRRSCKPFAMYHTHDQSVAYHSVACSHQFAAALTEATGKWGVTRHDIFLAIIFKVIAPFVLTKKVTDRKKKVALGSVINISRDLGIDHNRSIGVFLSSFTVSHAGPAGRSLEALAQDIRRTTAVIKKRRLYLVTLLEQWLGLKWMPFLPREQQMKFYPKNYPLWAGVSNMNYTGLLDELPGGGEIPISFAAPTGPNCPIVFAITRGKKTIDIGLSYRVEVFSRDEIETIGNDFLRYAKELTMTMTMTMNKEEGI